MKPLTEQQIEGIKKYQENQERLVKEVIADNALKMLAKRLKVVNKGIRHGTTKKGDSDVPIDK